MKKMLFIINPRSGKEQIRSRLLEILDSFVKAGYGPSVYITQGPKDAEYQAARAKTKELVVCSGGDGTLDEVVSWLLDLGHIPSFCTACYRKGRTGDRFMSLVKRGQIANCCQPNALMTLKEYLEDYASPETKEKGIRLICEEMTHIPNPKIRAIAERNLQEIGEGKRDFRF